MSRGFDLASYPTKSPVSYQAQPTSTCVGPAPTGIPRLRGALKTQMIRNFTYLIFVALFAISPSTAAPQNLVLRGDYTIDVPPNYPTAKIDRGHLLTDGVPGGGAFWRNRSTLGWRFRSPILVFKLSRKATIEKVKITVGSKTSGEIFIPSYISVYVGLGDGGYRFAGASPLHRDEDNSPSGDVREVDISLFARDVTEVVIVTQARGMFLFLGEVQILGDWASGGDGQETVRFPYLTSQEDVHADSTKRRKQAIADLPGKPTGPDFSRRWNMPIALDKAAEDDTSTDKKEFDCQIERIEPWSDVVGKETAIDSSAPLIFMADGMDTTAFRIVNRTNQVSPVSVSTLSKQSVSTKIFALSHVQALNYSWVPDVLALYKTGEVDAQSQMIIFVQISSTKVGKGSIEINVICGKRTQNFSAPLHVLPDAHDVPKLHGNLWVYLHNKRHAPAAGALACDPKFFSRYGVDTVVVHPSALIETERGYQTKLLTKYLRTYRHAKRILLFMDVNHSQFWQYKNQDDEAAVQWFRHWWAWLSDVAKQTNTTGELILYPIDEPKLNDIPLLLKTIRLLRKAGVSARSYATVSHKTAIFLKSIDFLQLSRPTIIWRRLLSQTKLESYDARHDSKLLSTNNHYRMRGWRAYRLNLVGVGKWAAWDSTGADDPTSGWSPFVGGKERDYGMLYLGPDGCGWPSRRLAAFQRGIEENRILRVCARTLSANRVDDKVAKAIEEPSDSSTVRSTLEDVVGDCVAP